MKRGLIAVSVLLFAAAAHASFEENGAGARAPGLGDAFTALADDVYALHYNPAGLAQIDRPQLGLAYSKLYVGLSDGSDMGSSQFVYAQPLKHGKRGVLGFGLDRFTLGSLYQEQVLSVSYGRKVLDRESGSQLLTGLSIKQLGRSFSAGAEAGNACDGLNCNQGADPVLSGKTSKSTIDTDLGFLYRFPRRFQLGLSILHLNSPNVAFSGSDKVERAINLGLAYKSLWLSIVGEIKTHKDASGKMAKEMIVGAERYFPTLEHGQLGLRGALGLGSGEYRQMTMGASYRINKIQTDYAFILPVGAVKGNSGSHRMSLTFHFGAPTADEEISQELLSQAEKLRKHGPDYGYEYSEELKPQDLSDARLAGVRELIEKRQYRLAHAALVEIAKTQKLSQGLLRLSNRLELAAYHYAELPEPASQFDRALAGSLRRFIDGADRLAVLQASYAFSMKPEDARLGRLLEEMEKAVGIKAERLPPSHPRSFMEELLWRVEFAHTRGEVGKVESQLSDIIALEPDNVTALERLGSLRYLSGRYLEAITIWETAAKTETRENELLSIREYIKLARERAGGAVMPGGVAPAALVPVVAPEIESSTSAATAPAPRAAPAPESSAAPAPRAAAPGDARDIDKLYARGVEFYSHGEYLQATAAFMRILQIDPENGPARKALERIDRRRPRR
ncbi:MAG: type IX secretion system membrane protein PorP/SprF [Elusimicrobia bacterium]|nr:type IX secretion system membrane protein PorP/SprF [Elusimicrobiota bacterium]